MSDKIHYPLKTHVTLANGAVLSEVTLREPEVNDMIAVEETEGGETRRAARLLARMVGLDDADFGRIKSRDALAMKALADAAWGNAEQGGGTSP